MVQTHDRSESSPRRLRPTDVLKHEHRQIEEKLEELSELLRAVAERGPDETLLERVEQIAGYIDEEMALHHRKEEEALFPVLAPHLEEAADLDSRVADHEDLRIMNGKFRDALEDCRRSGRHDGLFAARMLKGYGLYIVHLVLEHLLKEDQILFLIAERYLSEEQEAEIFRRFRAIEEEPA